MREQKCPNCGGNEIVFDNGRYKCTFCGTVFTDKTADKATYKYASRISQATEHLKIGNYDRAYSIAKELEDLHPTDSNPYAIILLSLTSKLSDYHLEEEKRQEASDVWDKMEQLNTVAQPMIDYAEIMYRKKMNMLKAAFIRDAVFIGFGIIMLINASLKYPGWSKLFVILDILYSAYYCWLSRTSENVEMYKIEKYREIPHNPFLTPLHDSLLETLTKKNL